MDTQTKATPQSLAELAQALLELANHVERVTEGTQTRKPYIHQPEREYETWDEVQIVDRMLADGADDYIAAFHGLTYAWIVAVMPHLEDVLSFDAKDHRRTVVLEHRRGYGVNGIHNRFEFSLPRSLDSCDDEWAGRKEGE